ncbi:MAG TPA: protein kinase, partial [Pyrinomonadaceae bacterium]|nr:protein kinase [Pyrinomonadaceae bacterium]
MTSLERDTLIAELFAAASDLSVSEREAFLARECAGEPAVLAEVRNLFLAHADVESNGFLEQPAIAQQARETPTDMSYEDRAGQVAGRYRFLNLIGEGGMGEVYRAQDTELHRTVALKLIRSALKTKEILRRFHNERQILSQLNHDHIARLFDVGTTNDGVPFLVMEFVDGQPIDDYCRGQKPALIERLQLFRGVCSAVQYAHQHLIVHRDLKPSNVLVTAEGQAKLLDFGIAKLLDATAEAETTATVWRVMTPQYASPEQVKGEAITTATDVYALGVMLYELLTGAGPYLLSKGTTDEVIKAICEQEVKKPSEGGSAPPAVAGGPQPRRVGPPATGSDLKSLRGDLDNIVLKALRKEPSRRYQSVAEFSEDIRRFIDKEPVSARKDTLTYRGSKFIQRHKMTAAAAAAVVLVLILGGAATAWEAHRARVQRAIAEQRFDEVRQIAHAVMFDYHDAIATLPGSTKIREQMVKDSLKYLDKLAQQAGDDSRLLREIGSAYLRVGDVQGRAYYPNLGDMSGAMESYRKSMAIREKLSALEPKNPDLRGELAMSYERNGRLNIARGNPAVAIENLQKAEVIYDELSRRDPANRPLRGELALVNSSLGIAAGFSATNSLGDEGKGMEYQRKALRILEPLVAEEPANPTYRKYLGAVYLFIASLYVDSGKLADALDNYRRALAIDQAMAQENAADNYTQRELAVDYSNICNVMRNLGDPAGALENGRRALAIFEKMAAADPDDANIAEDLAIMHQNIGVTLTKLNDS